MDKTKKTDQTLADKILAFLQAGNFISQLVAHEHFENMFCLPQRIYDLRNEPYNVKISDKLISYSKNGKQKRFKVYYLPEYEQTIRPDIQKLVEQLEREAIAA